jgi:hypothetical protein
LPGDRIIASGLALLIEWHASRRSWPASTIAAQSLIESFRGALAAPRPG